MVLDETGRITALGPAAAESPIITAGFYVFDTAIFAEIDARGCESVHAHDGRVPYVV